MGSGFDRRTVLKGTVAPTAVSLAAFEIIAVAAREVANLKSGEFLWMPERSPSGPVAIIVPIPGPARPRLSQRRPHRPFHLLNGQEGAFDADWHFHDPAKGRGPPLEHLQQRTDSA